MKPDVVFCIGPSVGRDEFQYALRSLDNLEHGEVWIVGHKPKWVRNVIHVPFDGGAKWQALNDVWRVIASVSDITERFYYSEDDYFITKPVEGEIPNYYLDTLDERVLALDEAGASGGWSQSLRATREVLVKAGIPHPISFDVHIPMLVEKERIPLHLDDGSRPLRYRSLVGNFASRPPKRISTDVKTVSPEECQRVHGLGLGFLSSNEATFESSGVKAVLAELFPNPSRYER